MYKNSVIHILENIENRKRKNKHMFLYQYNYLLSPLGFIFFLLPHFSLCWALDTHVEDIFSVLTELLVGKETSSKPLKRSKGGVKVIKWIPEDQSLHSAQESRIASWRSDF